MGFARRAANRVVFMADGKLVDESVNPTRESVLQHMSELQESAMRQQAAS